ncbi:MAG: hypothetical protein GY853_14540 [PVC group bacterium]|nr:hypothetical protein [PVC group bacterium]
MKGRIQRADNKADNIPPKVGNIRIGIKDSRGIPKAIDYFLCDSNYKKTFNDVFGEKPNLLKIVFPSDKPEEVCRQQFEGRDKAGNLVYTSDGINHMLFNYDSGCLIPCEENELLQAKERGIRVMTGYGRNKKTEIVQITQESEVLFLKFMIIKMSGILGTFVLTTKAAASSIPSIIASFDYVLERAGPNFIHVPFDLSVKIHKSNKPGTVSKYPVLTLAGIISPESLLILAKSRNISWQLNEFINDENINQLGEDTEMNSNVKKLMVPDRKEYIINDLNEFRDNILFEVSQSEDKRALKEDPKLLQKLTSEIHSISTKSHDIKAFFKYLFETEDRKINVYADLPRSGAEYLHAIFLNASNGAEIINKVVTHIIKRNL